MWAEQDFDSKIRAALTKECDDISASEQLKCRIDESICKKQAKTLHLRTNSQDGQEWRMNMRHRSMKKIGIIVAAACLLVSGITVVAGKSARINISGSATPTYTDYADLEKAEEKLGYAVDSVEQFTNGYSFEDININELEAYGEEDNKLYHMPTMQISYTRDDKDIDLYIQQRVEELVISKQPDATRTCGDVLVRCDEYTYKFVPASYELTEEDKANEQKDNYFISYGSDEIEITKLTDVRWEKDGLYYELLGFDLDLNSEEMLDMAEEILMAD